ncbi:helix-turn-helix transcriptional regulator [Halospeciosus flavus]|uniref:Helix-turn-helix transcriptional regulator n=1 Tax=Halospeciosus flavus TaxID=3032283 RepID=A0ABD5Z1H1_9EURY|nr:hypothetical protein [Halospeciosus flavus]
MSTLSRDRLAAALAVLVVVALLPVAGSVPAAGATATAEQPTFSNAHFEITVAANGSARWTFHYQTTLDNETERQQFREFARTFEQNRTDLYTDFRRKATSLVADGENVTGRSMVARDFSRRAAVTGLDDNLGVIEMSFTWTNFARTTDGKVVVGDLFEGGLYLGPDQRLVFETGAGLQFASVSPDPAAMSGPTLAESDSVTWTGQREFTDEHPRLVLVDESAGAGDAGQTEGASDADGTTDSGLGAWIWMGLGAVLTGVVAAGVWFWRRDTESSGPGVAAAEHETETETEAGSTADEQSAPAATETETAATPAVTDEEMLTDEERVHRLLEEHGGRMRQVNIVEETDWSKSKVSMLLSGMEEEDQITRLRVGRENVVTLPGHEPDAVGRSDADDD